MSQQIIPPPRPPRGMAIRGLIPRLPERGKLKIGRLGEERTAQGGNKYRLPVKLEHFVITTMERDSKGDLIRDEAMHERFGDKPTVLPVRLLYDDPTLNMPTRYACYKGRTLWCAGNGESAQRLNETNGAHFEVECTCPLADPTIARKATEMRCKMNGALSVLIDGATGIGGVWKFRTTSYNSILGLLSSMSFIRQMTGGPLANIPLNLTIQGRQAANPVDGTPVQIYVVGLEFAGDMDELMGIGHAVALKRAEMHLSIEHIEEEARRRLSLPLPRNAPLPGDDDAADIVAEYYPEQNQAPPRPTPEQFAAEATDGDIPGEDGYASGAAFYVVNPDGEVVEYGDPDEAADGLLTLVNAADTGDAVAALRADNAALPDRLREAGRDDLAIEIEQAWAVPVEPLAEVVAVKIVRKADNTADWDATKAALLAALEPLAAGQVKEFRVVNKGSLAALRESVRPLHDEIVAAMRAKETVQ